MLKVDQRICISEADIKEIKWEIEKQDKKQSNEDISPPIKSIEHNST